VYINDPSGLITSDELSRIQDAINAWDNILTPYNVTITEVSDPTLANIVIDTNTTSACGGLTNGVLGCFNAPNSEITLIQGWNWYAGSDPTQIGASQYDFEPTVLHELGHALGLGGSTNSSSPMYETLAAGVANRAVSTQDLNIPDPPSGADPQMVAGFNLASTEIRAFQNVAAAFNPGPTGLAPLVPAGAAPSSYGTGTNSMPPSWTVAETPVIVANGAGHSLVLQGTDREPQHGLIASLSPDSRELLPPPSLDSPHGPAEPTESPPLTTGRNGGVTIQPADDARTDPGPRLELERIERFGEADFDRIELRGGQVGVSTVDELAVERLWARGSQAVRTVAVPVQRETRFALGSESAMVKVPSSRSRSRSAPETLSSPSRAAGILLAAGFCAYGATTLAASNPRVGSTHPKGRLFAGKAARDNRGRPRA
jgi:hypothetical protein